MPSSFVEESKKYAIIAAKKAAKDVVGSSSKKKKEKANGPLGDKDDPVDELIRVAAAVVGFTSEAVQYRKEKKKLKAEDSCIQDPRSAEEASANPRLHEDREGSSEGCPTTDKKSAAEQTNEAIWRRDEEEQDIQATSPSEDKRASVQQTRTAGTPNDDEAEPDTEEAVKASKESSNLVTAFLKRHPYSPGDSPQARLTVPVVVPQRRPKNRARGFVRAYAPVLASAGINQETFLDFVDTFNKSLEPNPYLNVINLAGFAGEAAPEPFTMLIGLAVDVGTYALIEADSRNRSARFLDRANAEFFMPRGLVCFCATWKSDAASDEKLVTAVDFEGKTVEAATETGFAQHARNAMMNKSSRDDMMKNLQQQIQDRMKPCSGAFDWPDPAPLVFPSTDETKEVLCTKPDGKRKNGFDRGEVWMDLFSDRRAQAKWIRKNPGFNVASSIPKPEFKSRYADPNHPAASGDIVAFATAGKWSTRGRVVQTGADDNATHPDSEDKQEKPQPKDSVQISSSPEAGVETEKERQKREKKEEKEKERERQKRKEREERETEKERQKREKKEEKERERERQKMEEREEKERKKEKKKEQKEKEKKKGSKYTSNGFKSLFQKDVLYLIIIDIRPNAETVVLAQAAVENEESGVMI